MAVVCNGGWDLVCAIIMISGGVPLADSVIDFLFDSLLITETGASSSTCVMYLSEVFFPV